MEEFLKLDLSLLRSGLIFFCCCRDATSWSTQLEANFEKVVFFFCLIGKGNE